MSYRKCGANEEQYFWINLGMISSPEIIVYGFNINTDSSINLKSLKKSFQQ